MSLRKKAISGVLWTFTQQFSVQFINFGVQIVLARLLLPEAYGVIAVLQIFTTIGQSLMDGGMTSSLIRTVEADQRDYSTVFFINLFASIFIYLVLFLIAPGIETFFNQTDLAVILRVYTLTFIIQALVGVQTTRLTKELNFKLQMYMQIPATIIGGIVGIVLAYLGYGVWSLVYMNLSTSFIFMLQHWIQSGWRPSFIIDKARLKHHFNFGYKLTLSGLLTNVYNNLYTFIIAKFFSASQLGFYNQANNLRMFPVRNITSALQKVTYPIFSSIKDDDLQLKSVFKKITAVVFFVMTPIMFFLIVVAEPLFSFLLTDKWLPAVPFFQILCVSAVVYPQSMYNLNIITSKGKSDLHLKLEVIKKVTSTFTLLLIFPFGIWGVVIAQALSMLIHFFVNALYSGKMIGYSLFDQLKDLLPIFALTLFAMLVTKAADLVLTQFASPDFLRLIIGFFIFFMFYMGTSMLTKISAFIELKRIVFDLKSKRK